MATLPPRRYLRDDGFDVFLTSSDVFGWTTVGPAGGILTSQGPGNDPAFLPLASNPAMLGGYVNKFRNGNFDVAQRGTAGTVAAGTTAYTLDGWQVSATGAGCFWSQLYWNQVVRGIYLQCASGLTACTLQQRIESYVASEFFRPFGASQAVTIQWFIVNNSGADFTPQFAIQYANAQDNFSAVTSDIPATNLQLCPNGANTIVSYTFTPNSFDGINGMQVQLLLGGALNHATGNIAVAQADIRVTPLVPVGLNNIPPPAELRPLPIELMFCQRYLHLMSAAGAAVPTSSAFGGWTSFTNMYINLPLKVRSRVPFNAITISNVAHFTAFDFASGTVANVTSLVFIASEVDSVLFQTTVAAGGTAGSVGFLRPISTAATILFTGAEL